MSNYFRAHVVAAGLLACVLPAQIGAQSFRSSGASSLSPLYVMAGATALGNPALLAHSGFGLALPGVAVQSSIRPFGPWALAGYGAFLEVDEKQDILARANAHGSLDFRADVLAQAVGVRVGHIAFDIYSEANGSFTLPPELVELALFGNGSRDSDLFLLSGSEGRGAALTWIGGSAGMSIRGVSGLSVGSRLRYGIVHGAIAGNAGESYLDVLDGEVRLDGEVAIARRGSSRAFDLGVHYQRSGFEVGATVRGLVTVHSLDESGIDIERVFGVLSTQGDSTVRTTTDFVNLNPAEQQQIERSLDAVMPRREWRVAAGRAVGPARLMAGVLGRDGTHEISVGARMKVLPGIHVHGVMTEHDAGLRTGGGLTLNAGKAALDVSAASGHGSKGEGAVLSLHLSIGG